MIQSVAEQDLFDTDLELLAREALSHSHIREHHFLAVEHIGDTLYLQGRVGSYYYKQLAQQVVLGICQSVRVVNDIDVG